eukprot:gnl/TRDRNA2_/TRDRNA2_133598_c0_seq1.p1 gnl/TRDRNA2_/TRDRNA2_133598_c0~~gnl/TRDRNA2_/TRDRNA2_133598_c0_seq1.p1  ORF type:complete len:326 (+),score=55.10 gnl/TRDRNA2_/TRDRNA2_133598_c0_seq1:47-1024(+)
MAMVSEEVAAESAEPLRSCLAEEVASNTAAGEALLLTIPTHFRPLYSAPARLQFDALLYDFVTPVREMLDCPDGVPLSHIHEVERPAGYEPCPPLFKGMQLAGKLSGLGRAGQEANRSSATEGGGRKSTNRRKRDWNATPAYQRLQDVYRRFVCEYVIPTLIGCGCHEAIVQATPVLRVVMPSKHCSTKAHRDCEYGHIAEEINFWLPLSPVSGTNSLFAESFPGRGDATAFEGEPGDVFRWWGNQCRHWCEPNSTSSTRVSLDFRVIPKSLWDAAEATSATAEAEGNKSRHHLGDLRIGSYYMLERSLLAAPSKAAMPVVAADT